MPASRDEWDTGRTWTTLEAQILAFLRQNKEQGFKVSEIMNGLGIQGNIKDFPSLLGGIFSAWAVNSALEKLIEEGTVEAKIIKDEIGEDTYYRAK